MQLLCSNVFLVFFELIENDYLVLGFHCWCSKVLTTVAVVGKNYEEVHWKQSVAADAYSNTDMVELVAGTVVGIAGDTEDKIVAKNYVAGLESAFVYIFFYALASETFDSFCYNSVQFYNLRIP